MSGKFVTSSKLRIGFFAQHQVDELYIDETPIQHLMRERPAEGQARLRARLAGFGLGAAQAETEVGRLSGGQKARHRRACLAGGQQTDRQRVECFPCS